MQESFGRISSKGILDGMIPELCPSTATGTIEVRVNTTQIMLSGDLQKFANAQICFELR
jgi:hypothetical protein